GARGRDGEPCAPGRPRVPRSGGRLSRPAAPAGWTSPRAGVGPAPPGPHPVGPEPARGDRGFGGAGSRAPAHGDLHLHHRCPDELPSPPAREPGSHAPSRPALRDERVPLGLLPPPSGAPRQPVP